jgi:predicted DNA repair protein MutK
MVELLAHVTERELPGIWLVACGSFAAGAAVMYAILWARKVK